ncbi:ribonuclease H-like domain-containing protein [Sutcliffiella horikoshii]|uniref:ribonuclease H-like domain-containing protein n=1 Tax=Sutcliffiella horikoshii TaxID=79883 RepID=UPI001CC0055D|nr:ribonuclease H-like domain-containing protein [Sutcliffiella horikoshii]UAL45716.1 ribonuclease H-like domain-containing protein [Sutcliffiella horikoshii]
MSMKNKLNRMRKHLQSNPSETSAEERKVEKVQDQTATSLASIPNLKEWEAYGVTPYYANGEYCLIREVEYDLNYKHGKYRLGDLLPVMEEWQKSSVEHPLSAKGHQANDLFFFDTETTGLSGGTGTTIFLLGYARVLRDKVVVRQHLLPGPGNEVALYQSFLEEVDYTTLVTYNGKAFDWPQVKTRHTLIREHVPKLPAFGHYDLLHASRRLWKNKLESVRLANVEKEILEIERKDDIPGFLAPMIYFDFVKTHEMQGIKGVMKHNEWDVLTLITLYAHLSSLLLVDNKQRDKMEEYEIGRWYDSLGEKEAAKTLYSNISDSSPQATFNLGMLKKKEQNYKEAKILFLKCFADENNLYKETAGIEIAKILEHKEKDYSLALFYAEKSLEFYMSSNNKSFKNNSAMLTDLEKRINRLKNKSRN